MQDFSGVNFLMCEVKIFGALQYAPMLHVHKCMLSIPFDLMLAHVHVPCN